MKWGRKGAVLVAILVLGLAGAALASSLGTRFAHGKDQGHNPEASAFGLTKKPRVMRARITSRPTGMPIGAKYSTNCAKGSSSGTRGHEFAGRTPVVKKLRHRFTRPDVCQGGIIARMKGRGTIVVALFAKRQ